MIFTASGGILKRIQKKEKSSRESVSVSFFALSAILLSLVAVFHCFCILPRGVINKRRQCFQTTETLKIHNPEIKRKGLSPESFRNSLCMYSFSGETLWHMAHSAAGCLILGNVCVSVGGFCVFAGFVHVPQRRLHMFSYQRQQE